MILFYLLIFGMPLAQHHLWRLELGELTLIKYLGLACLFYATMHLLSRPTFPPFFRTWQARLFLVFFAISLVSYTMKGPAFRLRGNLLLIYMSSLGLFFITLSVVDSLGRLRSTLFVLIGAYAFASLYVIREWQVNGFSSATFRPGWVVGDANFFTASALLSIPLAFYLMLEKRRRWQRLFCLGCLALILLGVTLCASRGGFLGLIAALLFTVWKSQRRARNLVLITVLVLPLSLLTPMSPLHRFMNPSDPDKGSEVLHKAAWKAGLRIIEAHPFLGIGLTNFKLAMPGYLSSDDPVFASLAHNMYIEIAAELGLPTFLIFLIILIATFRSLGRLSKINSAPALVQQAALGIQAGLVGFAVAGFFVSAEYLREFWFMLFLAVCLPSLAQLQAPRGEIALADSSTSSATKQEPESELAAELHHG